MLSILMSQESWQSIDKSTGEIRKISGGFPPVVKQIGDNAKDKVTKIQPNYSTDNKFVASQNNTATNRIENLTQKEN